MPTIALLIGADGRSWLVSQAGGSASYHMISAGPIIVDEPNLSPATIRPSCCYHHHHHHHLLDQTASLKELQQVRTYTPPSCQCSVGPLPLTCTSTPLLPKVRSKDLNHEH